MKFLIVRELNLEDIEPSDIGSDEPLFVDGLGLDSIDALEIGIILRKEYDIKIETASDDIKKHFRTVGALAAFIQDRQREKAAHVG